jgi:hypothetical protein
MAWNEIERDWRRFEPRVRRHWFRLAESDVASVLGKRDLLIQCVEVRYGFSREQAEKEVDAWAWLVTGSRAA